MSTFTITTPINGSSLSRLGSVASLAWSRSTTTATVTQTAHGMVTNDQINVTVTSDAAAVTTGVKTITLVNANSYTFTCLNAGAASGTFTAAHIDNYNINGGYLTVDTHTRFGLGSNTSASMGNITMSASLGGTIEFNSTLIRSIAYTGGSGNVPALDTAINQGSASGKLLGVYSSVAAAPTTAGSAMPGTGFILVRQWNSIAFAAGALTGLTASASGADRAGWLEIVGVDAFTATVNRLNLFKVRGEYYDFQGVTTDGVRATTYQLPNNGAITYCGGVEVETGSGTGIYECYPCAGSRTALLANIGTEAIRGKWCWISTTGLVRFGHDGSNSTGGFIPPSGRRIRVPNIFFSCCTAAALTVNVLPNATLATRYEFATTGGGVVDIQRASMNWYCNFNQPFSIALSDFKTLSSIVLTECASPIAWSNVCVGQEAANTQIALTMSLNFAGGTMDMCLWTRSAQAASGTYITSWADCSGFTITGERNHSLTKAANATSGTTTLTRVANSSWSDTVLGGGRALLVTCTDVVFNDSVYYDANASTTGAAIPMYAFDLSTNCLRCKFDGLTFGDLNLNQPYSGILQVGAAGCTDIKLRNIGTASSPLDLGGAQLDSNWARSTTTATVTSPSPHNLKTGDIIYVLISSDIAAITVGAKTLLSAPSITTFTFTCLNAGTASGTVTYYPTMSAMLCVLAAGAAANNVKMQRVYTSHTRTGILSGDNSSKNVVLESVHAAPWGVQLVPELNATMRGLMATPALTAQTSVYGTHFFDFYTTGTPANISVVSWSRSTTTATVTSNGHGLRTGDLINVETTSDASAIIKSQKTITATTSNAFTFACLNAGATSGTVTFAPMNGRISIQMNEATSETSDQISLTNGSAFTSAGGLYMPVIGQQADFIAPANIRGHSKFPIAEAVMAGGTITNYDIRYSLDGGTTYRNLYYPRAGAGGSSSSTNVTMTSTTGVEAGDYVFGTGIAPNAKVNSITNGTTLVVDIANTGTVSGTLRFNHLPSEAVPDALIGFPLRVRINTSSTNATAITSLYFFTSNIEADLSANYPLETVPLLVTARNAADSSLISGARVYLVADSGGPATPGTVILNEITDGSGQAYEAAYEFISNQPVAGKIRKSTAGSLFKTAPLAGTITSAGFNATAFMVSDS